MLFVNFIFTNRCVFVTESDVPVTTSIMLVITTTLSSRCHMHTSRRKDPGLTITGSLPSGPQPTRQSFPASEPANGQARFTFSTAAKHKATAGKNKHCGSCYLPGPTMFAFSSNFFLYMTPFLYIPGPTTSYFLTPRLKEKQEMNNLWLIVLVFLVLLFVSCLFPQPVCIWH